MPVNSDPLRRGVEPPANDCLNNPSLPGCEGFNFAGDPSGQEGPRDPTELPRPDFDDDFLRFGFGFGGGGGGASLGPLNLPEFDSSMRERMLALMDQLEEIRTGGLPELSQEEQDTLQQNLEFQLSELDRQASQARDQNLARLLGRGVGESTIAGRQAAQLEGEIGRVRQGTIQQHQMSVLDRRRQERQFHMDSLQQQASLVSEQQKADLQLHGINVDALVRARGHDAQVLAANLGLQGALAQAGASVQRAMIGLLSDREARELQASMFEQEMQLRREEMAQARSDSRRGRNLGAAGGIMDSMFNWWLDNQMRDEEGR